MSKLSFYLLATLFAYVVGESVLEIPLKHKTVNKDALRKVHQLRMTKHGKAGRFASNSKLFENPYTNDYLIAEVGFGTPAQQFDVMISTGSIHVWLINDIYRDIKANNKHAYSPDHSSTANEIDEVYIEEVYGSYFTRCDIYTDAMHFGNKTTKLQGLGVVSNLTDLNGDFLFPADGVLGLFWYNRTGRQIPDYEVVPIENILKNHHEKTFTLFVDKQIPPSQGISAGQLTVGGSDTTNCLSNTPAHTLPFVAIDWSLSLYGLQVDSFQYNRYVSATGGFAVVDTMLSTLALPQKDYNAVIRDIDPDFDDDIGFYTVDCTVRDDFPQISIKVNNQDVKIDSTNWIVDLDLDDGQCALALSVHSKKQFTYETHAFGTPFARQFCLEYNFKQNELNLFTPRNQQK